VARHKGTSWSLVAAASRPPWFCKRPARRRRVRRIVLRKLERRVAKSKRRCLRSYRGTPALFSEGTMGKLGVVGASAMWVVALVLQEPLSARGDDGALAQLVLRDYPRALRALEERFSTAKGVVKRSIERNATSKSAKRVSRERLVFECKRPYMARVVSDIEKTVTRDGTDKSTRLERVLCYNHEYTFELRREGAADNLSVTSFEPNRDGKSNMEHREMGNSLSKYLNAPFSLYVWPVSSIFAEQRLAVHDVSRVSEGKLQLLKVRFERKPDSKGAGGFNGWFLVSPDEAWVLRSYEYTDKNGIFVRGSIEYGDIEGGVPVPKRIVHAKGTAESSAPTQVTTYEFDEFNFADVPDSEFTLSAFGLPELRSSSGGSERNPARWLFAIACLGIVTAVALKTASSRLRARNAIAGA
jgi:hypothetical protein